MTEFELALFEEKIRTDERKKVIEEVVEILGNDFWQIAKVEQLKEKK